MSDPLLDALLGLASLSLRAERVVEQLGGDEPALLGVISLAQKTRALLQALAVEAPLGVVAGEAPATGSLLR